MENYPRKTEFESHLTDEKYKTVGHDMMINDFLNICLTRFFNVFLASGQVPDEWCLGSIKPIYKNKGDGGEPNNNRGTSLLSCLGKLFLSCINKRLTCYIEDKKTVGAE